MQRPFTKQAKKAIDLAVKAAKDKKQRHLGSEYILVGLLCEGTGVAQQILSGMSVREEDLFRLIDEIRMPEGNVILSDRNDLTPEAQEII